LGGLALIVSEISAFIRLDGQTDCASDPDQEYIFIYFIFIFIYFMWSETLPSACYILSDESIIPFYSTNNHIKITYYVILLCFYTKKFLNYIFGVFQHMTSYAWK